MALVDEDVGAGRRCSIASSLTSVSDDGGPPTAIIKTFSRRAGVSAETMNRSEDWFPPVYGKSPEERQALCDIITHSEDSKLKMMFGNLLPETFDQVLDAMFVKKVAAKQRLIDQGDEGDYFYIVKSGRFELFQKKPEAESLEKVFEAGPGFSFGELGLMYNALRSATVVAAEESEVWCLERMSFRMLVVRSAEDRFNQYVAFLRKCDIFSELSAAEVASLAEVFHEEEFEPDEAILEQGDRDDNMYILTKGEAVACIRGDQGEVEVKKYSQGEYFGEIALLLGEPRKASVYALGPATCLCISRDTFNHVLGPLRSFLERNIAKYQQYQEAISAAPSQERRNSREVFQERRLSGTGLAKPAKEIFEGGSTGVVKKVRKVRDRTAVVASDTQANKAAQDQAQAGMTLAERIEQDSKNPELAEPLDRFKIADATLEIFGSWRLGEKFTFDKGCVLRGSQEATASCTDEGGEPRWEDNYSWTSPSWLQGSTHAAVLCQKGFKDGDCTPNQDNYFVLHINSLQIYGVCDGHGPFGHLVSFRLVQSLPYYLTNHEAFGKDWEKALSDAFALAQEDLQKMGKDHDVNLDASGASGTVLVFEGPRIHVAYVGDSSCLVASWNRHDSRIVYGTEDHKPQTPEEKQRLEQAGMEVRRVDPDDESSSRIYLPGKNFPGLTMSRCFGDTLCKGLLQEPTYKQIMLQPSDEYYAIIASDGIWEFIPYDNGLDLSSKKLRLKGPRETTTFMTSASRKRWQACCGTYCDDITCLAVKWNINEKGTTVNHQLTVKRAA